MNEWVSLLQTFGLAVVIIFFMGVCIWKAGGWTAENVVKPLIAKYLELLNALISNTNSQSQAMVKVGQTLEKMGETMDVMVAHAAKNMQVLEQVQRGVSELKNVTVFAEQTTIVPPSVSGRPSGGERLGG